MNLMATQLITVGMNPAIDRLIEVNNLQIGSHAQGQLLGRQFAGKAANVSRALATMGVDNLATGFLGEEEMKDFESSLRDSGPVVCQFLQVAGRTRENITLIDQELGLETHIRDQGFTVNTDDLARMRAKIELLSHENGIILFAGSLPPGATPDDLREMVKLACDAGARVAVDVHGALLKEVIDLPLWLIKPNMEELSEALGRPLDDDASIAEALRHVRKNVDHILLSRGAKGAFLAEGGVVWESQVVIEKERVINTVGCGDCLMAGFLAGWQVTKDPQIALRRGMGCATANAVELQPACFDLGHLREFQENAVLTEWNPA